MKITKKRLAVIIIIILIGVAIANSDLGVFLGLKKAKESDEGVVISTMSIYKDMDYTFLKTYNFGETNSDKSVLTLDTTEELIESTDVRLKNNKYITTKGYYESGDLGGATYVISTTNQSYGSIALKNGLYANLVPDFYTDKDGKTWVIVSVKQFGAKGDGENEDQIGINAALSFAGNYANSDQCDRGIVYIPAGEYKAYNQIQANVQNINLVGDGDESIIFTDNDYRKDESYDEPFFASWNGKDNFFGFFKIDAREVDWKRYMRQMCLFYCENVCIYDVNYYIPQEAWSGNYYEDKQYTNLTIYAGNRNITVDNCIMYQMSGTYRGANIGIMDFWKTGTENITIMNCELHDNARDEQIGIFSVTGESSSYIRNVDFINNKVYTYTTPYKDVHGWRTMCFTVAYSDNEVDDINISSNHFISEADSKFMTFGDVTNCVIENNLFEIISSNGNMGYVFDSSNEDADNIVINNNEFFLTYKNSVEEGKCMAAGNLTFTNNRVFTDCTIGKFVDRIGMYDSNTFISVNPIASCGSPEIFTNNNVTAYGGHSGKYSEILFTLNEGNENTDIVYTGNTVNDYTYFYGSKKTKPYDRLSSINGVTINSLDFSENVYNCPNYRYVDSSDYIYISWYRSANISKLICKDNDFQGAKSILGYELNEKLNKTREFTSDSEAARISSIDITKDSEKVTEITTTDNTIKLDKIVRIADETDENGNVLLEKEVDDREIDWLSAIENIASVSDGVVTRNNYGDVYVYATSKDGSGVYAKVKIHFVNSKAEDIELEKTELVMQPEHNHDVMYKVLPYASASQVLEWTSSNESVAKVSDDGIITSVAVGETTITCTTTDGTNISKTIKVKVIPVVVTKITLSDTYDYYEDDGETKQLKVASYLPENAINKRVGRWESSNKEVATVDSNGFVNIVGRGVCTIYAYSTDESCYGTYNIYVKPDTIENFTVSTTKNQAILKWDTKDNIHGYNIYRYDKSTEEWTKIAEKVPVSTNIYYDTNLEADTEYKYYIVGYIIGWDTGTRIEYEGYPSETYAVKTNSSEVITSIDAGTTNLYMTVGYTGTISASYSPRNAECDGLNWEIADTSIVEFTGSSNNTKAKFKGLNVGFTTLTISSKDYYGASTTIPVGVMPNYQVENLEISSDYNSVNIKWKSIEEESEIDGYMISRTQSIEFSPIKYISKDELKKSEYSDGEKCYIYRDEGLTFGKSYKYVVTPYIIHDGLIYPCLRSSDKGITIEYVAVDAIIAEDEYVINLNETKEISVQSATDNATRPEFLWYSKDNDIVAVTQLSENTANLKGISTGITRIEIVANDEDCNYVSPKVVVLPGEVSEFKAIPDAQKSMLSWNAVNGATGYNIYRYNSDSNEWELLADTINCTYEDINLKDIAEYSYKICAYVSDGEKKYEGIASDEVNVKISSNESTDKLYFESEKYKIDENNEYLYRVSPNTTLEQFVANCDTNGTITIYKESGEKLEKNELVGTGMTISIEKDGQVITLILSIKGDVDGNGVITATDFAAVNQQVLRVTSLEGAYYMAADISEDQNVTVTDLSTINQVILKKLDLSVIE